MKFLQSFFGRKNPYTPVKDIAWMPDILTPRWWRWCLAYKGARPWKGMAKERIRMYYIRRVKRRVLQYPICLVKGHDKYETVDWSYNATKCSRCSRTLRYQSHAVTSAHQSTGRKVAENDKAWTLPRIAVKPKRNFVT